MINRLKASVPSKTTVVSDSAYQYSRFFFFLIDIEHKLHSNEILMNDRMRTVICTAYVKHRAYMGSGGDVKAMANSELENEES